MVFSRSGFTNSRIQVGEVWTGDQGTTFERQDGLPAALSAGLSLGV